MDGLLENAARQLLARLAVPLRPPAAIICSPGKCDLAEAFEQLLWARQTEAQLVMLASDARPAVLAEASERARTAAASGTLVLLIEPIHAAWLFSTVGRPDRGLQLPDDHLYCDWLLDRDALLRILQADYVELSAWRAALLAALGKGPSVHLATPAGTDLALEVGPWQALDGEVCAPLVPGSARSTLVLDGALYDAALPRPIVLQVRSGAIVDLDGLLRGVPGSACSTTISAVMPAQACWASWVWA